MSPAKAVYGKGLSGLIKRGWNEIPEILGAGCMGLIGFGLAAVGYNIYMNKGADQRRYQHEYTVIRHDDPRVAKIRKDYLE